MENFQPLNERERGVIAKVQRELAGIDSVPCTGCGYCMKGCPQGIAIPGVFGALNTYLVYNNLSGASAQYEWAGRKASACIECGQCESVCPQHISVIKELRRAAELFEK